MRTAALTVLSFTIALGAPAAQAQYTQKEWPEGPSKARFVATCDGCHDINRVRVGYTAEGWLTVVRMMQNAHAPVPAEEWGAMTDYLIRNFPERSRPEAAVIDGPVKANIRMWDVPTQGSRPHDPLAARDGSIWWTAQLANKLGRLDPKTGAIREYTMKSAFTGPHGLAEDKAGNIWFTGNTAGLIGKLDPSTGVVTEYPLPDANARDPHTLNFDQSGILWFTVQQANMIGRLDPATGAIKLITPPTPKARPYGLKINAEGVPVVVEFGTNKVATVDPKTLAIKEYTLPGDKETPPPAPAVATAPARDRTRRHGLVCRFCRRPARAARSRHRRCEGVAFAERCEIGTVRHRLHQRRAVVFGIRSEAEHDRAVRPGDREIPELGDPRRRRHRPQYGCHA
jgi:virginiamycin B lyase